MEKMSAKLLNGVNRLVSTDGVVALKNGTQRIIPITILGSVFMLIRWFPLPIVAQTLKDIFGPNWGFAFDQVINGTFNSLSIFMVLSIAYDYAKIKEVEALNCSLVALVCFLISVPQSVLTKSGDIVSGVFSTTWVGGSGSITSIIVALGCGWIYCKVLEKNWIIKMPESVPSGVVNAFVALIPGLISVAAAFAVSALFKGIGDTTLVEGLFAFLQIPMQLALGSIWGAIFTSIVISIFWMLGIHSSVPCGVVDPIFRANGLVNQQLIAGGIALSTANGAYLMTYPIERHIMQMSGSGLTIGLVLAMIICAKSERYKTLGKLAIVPSLFNVNEPVIFGFPIVFNFGMLIPFVAAPTIGTVTAYLATLVGFIPIQGSFESPWTCPMLFSGFLQWGWRGIVVQLIVILESFLIYYPFLRKYDKKEYVEEHKTDKD